MLRNKLALTVMGVAVVVWLRVVALDTGLHIRNTILNQVRNRLPKCCIGTTQ